MNSLAPREGYVGLYAAEHPPSPKLRRGRQMSNDEKNDEYFPAYASRILGSTPKAFGVVAGSPAGNIFGTCITEKTLFPGLGKLPRPRSRGAGSLCPQTILCGTHALPSISGGGLARGLSRVPAFKGSTQRPTGGRLVGCGLGVGVCLGVTVGVGDAGG